MPTDRNAYLHALYPAGLHIERREMDETRKAKIGDIVHYVLPTGKYVGEHRPGIVVKLWSPICVQLQVFTDSWNDFQAELVASRGLLWATSVMQDEAQKTPNTWHWPEEVE